MDRRWDKSKPPRGQFALNRDCPQARGLVAWYPMGAMGGRRLAVDRVGVSHITGTTSAMTLMGNGGPALSLNGSSDHLSSSQSVITEFPVSLHVFAKTNSPATTQHVFGVGAATTPGYTELASILIVGSKPWALSQAGSGANYQSIGATTIVSGREYGIGGIWSGAASRRVYLNGSADAAAETTSLTISGIDVIRVGRRANSNDLQYFSGDVGEAAVWNIAVSADVFARINDPGTRFELWYPLRSRKWFTQAGASTYTLGTPTYVPGSITSTGFRPRIPVTVA